MAEQQTKTKQAEKPQAASQDGGNGSNGGGHKTALRAVAIAAASGATAIAARKAFSSGRQGSESGQESKSKSRGSGGGDDDSLVTSMITSGWDAARDSLLPLAENAATSAGEFLAQSGPELVRETLVPRFIEGFESARDSDSSEDES